MYRSLIACAMSFATLLLLTVAVGCDPAAHCPPPCTAEGAACALTCGGPQDGVCVLEASALVCVPA